MKKQCPWCGRAYSRLRSKCPDCKAGLITANPDIPQAYSGGNGRDSGAEQNKYCSSCGEEFYSSVETCPDCGEKLSFEDDRNDMPMDDRTKTYWDAPDNWLELTIPQTYQSGFDLIRYLRDKEINALAAFTYDDDIPRPVTFKHLERLEANMLYHKIPNPGACGDDQPCGTYRQISDFPRLSVIVQKSEMETSKEFLAQYQDSPSCCS